MSLLREAGGGHDRSRLEEDVEAFDHRGGTSGEWCDGNLDSIHWSTHNYRNIES
jgi:hypothetical protein